jgi:hypothetical protein
MYSKFFFWETWISLIAGIACFGAYSGWPLHPKGGTDDIIAIVCFFSIAAIGMGSSLAGMRFCKSFTKAAACVAFALFAIVVVDLAKILASV